MHFQKMAVLLGWLVLMASSMSTTDGAISPTIIERINRINKEGPYLGIVVPNSFEMNPLLQSPSFSAHQNLPFLDFAGRRFRIGLVENKKVIVVMTGLAMVNAGVTTQLLLSLFKVKGVLHYGIAGNANPQLEIGDVTIPQYWAHTGLWNWQALIAMAVFSSRIDVGWSGNKTSYQASTRANEALVRKDAELQRVLLENKKLSSYLEYSNAAASRSQRLKVELVAARTAMEVVKGANIVAEYYASSTKKDAQRLNSSLEKSLVEVDGLHKSFKEEHDRTEQLFQDKKNKLLAKFKHHQTLGVKHHQIGREALGEDLVPYLVDSNKEGTQVLEDLDVEVASVQVDDYINYPTESRTEPNESLVNKKNM